MWNYYFCLTFVYRSLSNTQAIPSNFSLASITITHILSSLQSSVLSVILRSCAADCWLRGERGIYWALQECWYRQQPGRHVHPASNFSLLSSLWLTPGACRDLQGPGPQGCYKNKLELYFEHLHTKCGTQAESAHTGRSVWAPAKNGLQMNVYRIHSLYENRVRVCNGGS